MPTRKNRNTGRIYFASNADLVEAVKLNYAKYGKVLEKEDFGYLSYRE